MIKYGQSGEQILQIQTALIDRGYPLKTYGADGHLGDETWAALERFSKETLNGWAPVVPEQVITCLLEPPEPHPEPPTPLPDGSVTVLDLRSIQADPAPKSKIVNGRTVMRDPQTITSICIHQTACTYGVSQSQIDAAGGDRSLALHKRALNVACHAMAFMDGTVVITNNMQAYIQASNGLNSFSVALEIEGRYPGLLNEPDKTTWGGDPTPLTDQTIRAAREGIRQLVILCREQGIKLTHAYCHRQSSETRRSDPGEGLWRSVILDYAVPVLGLKTAPSFTVGSGKPVPVAWDPDGVGQY